MFGFIAILITLGVAVGLGLVSYYLVPNWIVRMWSRRFTKVDPNHLKLVQRGGSIVRVLVGANYRMVGNDLGNEGDYDILKIGERKKIKVLDDANNVSYVDDTDDDAKNQGGGTLDPFVSVLETWIFAVTGYKIIGASVADFFGATLVTYDLDRPDDLMYRNGTVKMGQKDTSDHIVLSPQIYPFKVTDAETGKLIETVGVEGKAAVRTRERVPVAIEGMFTFQVRNAYRLTYGTNFTYFKLVLATLKTGVRDEIQELGIDDLFSDKLKENVTSGVLSLNKDQAMEIKVHPEDDPEKQEHDRQKRSYTQFGTVERYGFEYTQLLVEDVQPDKNYLDDLAKQMKKILEMNARASEAELDVSIAGKQLQAQELRAKGVAAADRERLIAIASGGEQILGVLRNHTLTARVMVADRHAQADNLTVIANDGGVGPIPTINVNDRGGNTPPNKRQAGGAS